MQQNKLKMKEHYTIAENEDLITKFEFLKDMPGYFSVIDTVLNIKSMSPNIATFYGWNRTIDVIDQSIYQIPSRAVEAVELFVEYDNIVFRCKREITALQIVNCKFGLGITMSQATPIIDTNGIVKGIFFSAINLTDYIQTRYRRVNEADKKFINLEQAPKQYILTPEASPLPLSHRQQECLALLIRGKTYKEIAHMLNVSDRTIEDHMHAIKYKLGCYNKSQLIEKAIDSGFLFHVPETLFGLFSVE